MNLLHKPHDWYIDHIDGRLMRVSFDGADPITGCEALRIVKLLAAREATICIKSDKYRPQWFQRLCEIVRTLSDDFEGCGWTVAQLQEHANQNPAKFVGCNHTPRTFNHGERRLFVIELALRAITDKETP